MVRLAEGRGRRPGGLDQLRHAEPARQHLVLERRDIGIRRHRSGRNRILPDQRLFGDFRAEVARPSGPCRGGSSLNQARAKASSSAAWIVAEPLGDRAELGVHLQRHVGGRHHRRHALVRIARVGRHVFGVGIDRLPLLGAGRALDQLIIVLEQQAEIVAAPLGRVVRPGALDARGGDVALADLLLVGEPAQALQVTASDAGSLRNVGGLGAMRLAKGVAAGGERNRLLAVHRHAQEGRLHVARRLQRIGIAARPFGIDVDQAHLDRRERPLEFGKLLGSMRVLAPWLTQISSAPQKVSPSD